MKRQPTKPLLILLFSVLLITQHLFATDRYWVHKPFYENFFSTAAELAQWNIVEDNGSGTWSLTGNGTALLKMDNSAGGYANRMFNMSGASANLLPLDRINGRVEIMVRAITGGNQRIFVQVQQFNASNTYISEFSVLPSQSATGFFTINLSAFSWDPAADKVRFIIGGENYSFQQGTVEFDYFSYSNSNNDWNNTANWSSSSNGAGGASVPGATDMAIFDGAGGSNGSSLLTSASSVLGLQITNGYSGNLDLQGYQFTMGSSGVNIAGGGVTGNGSTIYINSDVTMSGGAYKNTNGYNHVSGNMIFTGGVLDFSTGHVIFDAAGDQQFSSTLTDPIHKLVVNKSSGVITFNSDILIADSLVLTQGILNANGHTIRLGLSSSSIGKLVTGSGRITGTMKRWISAATTGDIDFPLGDAAVNALMTVTVNSVATAGGSIIVTYNDATPGYTPVVFPEIINTSTVINRATASWTILTSGISGGSYSLSASNNHLGSFTSLTALHLTLSASVIAVHQSATGSLANPILHRSSLTSANLSQTWYASLAVPVMRKIAVLGSSTAVGTGCTTPDSSWVGRLNYYYKYQLASIDTTYNLAVGGTTSYNAMPTTYTPPASRPFPDPLKNVSKSGSLLSDLLISSNGVTIVNFPTNGFDTYSIAEIMSSLQIIYDSATITGNKCFICTTQPRTDAGFNTSAVKRKLADIKDSIINRFGEAHTINFWDGMFNPADTTILTAYSAGDNVHFNNRGHWALFNRVLAKNIFSLSYVEAAGDYRSNVSPTGLWSDPTSWQTYNGTSWVAASVAPTNADGIVTMLNGDSIRINSAVTYDQVVIESGAVLTMFNLSTATNFTLNDGPGSDIENNGHLYISVNGILNGNGTIQNNSGGLFTLRNFGVMQVNTSNDGNMVISGTGSMQNSTFINNGILTLISNTLNLNSATLVNNDSISIASAADSWFAGTGTSYLLNNPGAVMYKSNALGIAYMNGTLSFTNSGSLKGIGQYNISTTLSNTGIIRTGNTAALLTLNPPVISGKTPTLEFNLRTTGSVAGINYDKLELSTASNTNFSGATLNVTDNANDAIGTIYTIVSSPLGTITGPFATVNLSATLGNLTYNSNSITIQKLSLSTLPLIWGAFTVVAENDNAVLRWTTLQESNTSHFVIEYSADGRLFTAIGTVTAAGNSHSTLNYTFLHTAPRQGIVNYYRLKQVDIDNRANYSDIRSLKFVSEKATMVRAIPNPVKDMLNVTVLSNDISIRINDISGRLVFTTKLQQGTHHVNTGKWLAGLYQLSVYEKGQLVETKPILKL